MSLQSLGQIPAVPTPQARKSAVLEAASTLARPVRSRLKTWLDWCNSVVDRALGIELRDEEWHYLNDPPKRPPERKDD